MNFIRAAVLLLGSVTAVAAADGVVLKDAGGKVRVEIGGELFTEYHYQDVARPYLYPLIGPGGAGMTRNWPMQPATNEPTDHVHHKGLWYAHGSVNGVDCWSEQKAFGKTVHEKFLELGGGVIRERCNWVDHEGKVLCSDERTLRFQAQPDVRIVDFAITLIASQGPVTFGDTKEGSMAIRLPATLSVKGKGAQGHIVTSAGQRDAAAWGTAAEWVDYHGPVDGKVVGVAIFDAPQNPRHPTTWHVRDYGLFAANPFGLHDFKKGEPKGAGDLKLAAGERATFRYRFVFHTGDEQAGKVAERYREFAGIPAKP
jgi:hypothetical protein